MTPTDLAVLKIQEDFWEKERWYSKQYGRRPGNGDSETSNAFKILEARGLIVKMPALWEGASGKEYYYYINDEWYKE